MPDSLDRLSQEDVSGVVGEVSGDVGRLRAENEKLSGALTKLKTEHQAIKDELARLKNLPPRPPQKPSGMDKASDRGGSSFDHRSGGGAKSGGGGKSPHRRGSQLDKLTIDATVVVRAKAPAGSRHKGYEEVGVQDLNLSPQGTLYGRGDFKAASRALADGQARDIPRRGRSGVESRPRRRLCHG